MTETTSLDTIIQEIHWHEEQARQGFGLALQHKLEIGKRLAIAKAELKHGEFLPWAQAQFGWAPANVWRHLELARNISRVKCLPTDTSLRMALKAIRSSEQPEEPGSVAVLSPVEKIYLTVEVIEGCINRELFLDELRALSCRLGATKTRWTIR